MKKQLLDELFQEGRARHAALTKPWKPGAPGAGLAPGVSDFSISLRKGELDTGHSSATSRSECCKPFPPFHLRRLISFERTHNNNYLDSKTIPC